jgi:hypothetical protein
LNSVPCAVWACYENLKFKVYRTIILAVVLYGYETWFLAQWKADGLRVFEIRRLKRMFVLKERNNKAVGTTA